MQKSIKNLNALTVKYFQPVMFVYKGKNAIFLKKQKIPMRNALNDTFVKHIVFEKNNINGLQKTYCI